MRGWMLSGCLSVLVLLSSTAAAQEGVPKFPRDGASWINSAPITEETLKGKAAVLFFFEES